MITALEDERLRLEAERYVGSLSYSALCDLVPRIDHWWEAGNEDTLCSMQRKSAVEKIYQRLKRAVMKDTNKKKN